MNNMFIVYLNIFHKYQQTSKNKRKHQSKDSRCLPFYLAIGKGWTIINLVASLSNDEQREKNIGIWKNVPCSHLKLHNKLVEQVIYTRTRLLSLAFSCYKHMPNHSFMN